MTEATFIRRLVGDLRRTLPAAVIFKHADRVTAGVPDLSVTHGGRTWWLEAKYLPRDSPAVDSPAEQRRVFSPLQLGVMSLLCDAGRATYVVGVGHVRGLQLWLLPPDTVRADLAAGLGVISAQNLDRCCFSYDAGLNRLVRRIQA